MKKTLTPGMDPAQENRDRGGFTTTVENLTGGTKEEAGSGHGPEVGNNYGSDPLGEERDDSFTYGNGSKAKE